MKHKNNIEITVPISKLIEKIEENLSNHKAQVEKARKGFEKEALELLTERLEQLRMGKLHTVYLSLAGVEDHSGDYQLVIEMLQMHTGREITIEAEDFARYVRDDWDWKTQWLMTNSKYLG